MAFLMDGLDAEAYDRSYDDRQLVRRIAGYFGQKHRLMVLISAMIVLNSLMDTALPILVSDGIDRVARDGTGSALWVLVGAILVAGGLSWGFNFVRQFYTSRVVGDVVLRLRLDAFGAVMDRDMSFYDENPSGKIVSRVTSDTDDFATVVVLVLNLFSQLLLVVLLTGVLFYRDA